MQCEGCHEKEGSLFCLTCKRYFCISCDAKQHPGTHASVNMQNEHKCKEHDQPVCMFCESCSKLLCSECLPLHHANFHRLLSIPVYYRKETADLTSNLNSRGYPRKALLESRISERRMQISALEQARSVIAQENEYIHMDMLQNIEKTVQPAVNMLERHLEILRENIHVFEEAMEVVQSKEKTEFLARYRETFDKLMKLSNAPEVPEPSFDVACIPRELEQLRNQAKLFMSFQSLNETKNNFIWSIVNGRFAVSDGSVKRQVLMWSRLTDQYLMKLAGLHLYCFFCKVPLDVNNVNGTCNMNERKHAKMYLHERAVPPKYLGNGFHYFTREARS